MLNRFGAEGKCQIEINNRNIRLLNCNMQASAVEHLLFLYK